ncbi:Crp/Fnr family transcriptional regulator [Aquimarina brevivitae]|uniref:CRP-like cAMP-binding protein n=1 Tax=Aquimarina brevivitae TaxID=323412 RepID=A0A4Q7PIQ6_9FLAO|nr:Crp/Fnr family transcriptional regulator [Aquimarina brevivitae]RZS99888.1 CRP-like cAMP-binding protein [Aquimarina brevivitae]
MKEIQGDTSTMVLRLKTVMNELVQISNESWSQFEKSLNFYSVEKDQYIIEAGQMPKDIFFIYQGAVIIYYTDASGKRYTKNLLFENDFPSATSSLIQGTTSNVTIESIEKTLLVGIDFKKFRRLAETIPDIQRAYLRYLEINWIVKKEDKEFLFATKDATEKYLSLLQQYPDIEQRIALYHIASYLNITSTQLSRIRKELESRKT